MTVKPGDILTVRGCIWNDGWEFSAPMVLYHGIKRYSEHGSICGSAVAGVIEDYLIDICIDKGVYDPAFSAHALKEFGWRGWSLRFDRRVNAIHAEVSVRFHADLEDTESLTYDIIGCREWSGRTGESVKIYPDIPKFAKDIV